MRRDDPAARPGPDPRGLHQALDPWLERLTRIEAQGSDAERDLPARVRVGGRALMLEPWERAQLRAASVGHSVVEDSSQLIARTIAVLAKSLVDIERFNQSDPGADSGLFELQAELMLDEVIGADLLGRTQRLVEGRISAGRMDEAKRVTDLQSRLRRTMTEVHQRIVESEHALARKIGGTPEPHATAVDDTLDRLSREIGERRGPRPRARSESRRDAVRDREARAAIVRLTDKIPAPSMASPLRVAARRGLTVLLGVTLVVLTVVRLLSSFLPADAPTDLTTVLATPNLDPFAIIEQLRSRRPSLFVTVRAVEWWALSEADRSEAVERLTDLAAERGYTGVLLRTERRRPVAQWFAGGGQRLIDTTETEGEGGIAERGR